MPALSFSIPRLVPAILDGTKANTFRVVRAGRPCRFDVGQSLYLYWKQRTRDCTKLAEARCVDLVVLLPRRPSQCAEDDFLLAPSRFLDLDALARADGFATWPELQAQLWQMYAKLFLKGGIAAVVSVRWAGLQEDLFARTRLAKLGVATERDG